jgi:NitT/TauT family transport system ATP-binding protein
MITMPSSRPAAPATADSSSGNGIVLESVTVGFGRDLPVLSNVDLTVAPGEFVSIVGASGCGKTTLMNVVAGLVAVDAGSALVGGTPPKAGRPDIAYILSRDALLPWKTVQANVEYALMLSGVERKARADRARSYLEKVGLTAASQLLPAALSHGMRQRVALARAFAVERSVYLLDEPFSALDAQTKLVLQDQLLTLWDASRKTVVFVTHDIGEAVVLSDRIIVMAAHGGGIIAEIDVGLPRPRSSEDLQESPDYHEVYRLAWHALRKGMT